MILRCAQRVRASWKLACEGENLAGKEGLRTTERAHYSLGVVFPPAPVENQPTLRNGLYQTSVPRSGPAGSTEKIILARALMAPLRAR